MRLNNSTSPKDSVRTKVSLRSIIEAIELQRATCLAEVLKNVLYVMGQNASFFIMPDFDKIENIVTIENM